MTNKVKFLIEDMAWVLHNFTSYLNNHPDDFSAKIDCANAMWIISQKGYGDIYMIDDFLELVEEGYVIDYDGSGHWCDDEGNELGSIRCDVDWLKENKPEDAKFILWFNK